MPPINLKGSFSVKLYFIAIKIAHAHLYYVHRKYSWFQTDSLEIVGEVNSINSISFKYSFHKKLGLRLATNYSDAY